MKKKIFKHPDGVIRGHGLDTFEFGDLGVNVDDLPVIPYHDYPQLNQYAYTQTKSSCTIVGSFIDACYLYEIKPSQADMLECVTYAHDNCGYIYGKGRYADLGMRAVEKFFEQKYNKKVYYSTMTWDDPSFWKLLKKGYMVGTTFGGNYAYSKDYQTDNVLDGSKFGTATYFHRTSIIYRDNKIWVVDSAAGNTYNVYEVKEFTALIQNGVYDPTFFIYTKETELPAPIDTKELARLVQLRNLAKVSNFNDNKALALTKDSLYQNALKEAIAIRTEKISYIDEAIKTQKSLTI